MLNLLIIAIVCFLASTLGPLCGIGGGVIIKPICPRAPNPREPHAQARGTRARPLVHTLPPVTKTIRSSSRNMGIST